MPNDLPTLRNYYSQMTMVDEGVGAVLGALDARGLADDTLIIHTSDHGMSLGEHGFWGHGEDSWPSHTHREANHIPMIVKPPRAPRRNEVRDNLVGTADIFATVLDYTGTGVADPDETPGRSLRPLLESDATDWEDVMVMEQEETRSIRTRQWNFMRRFQPTPYDFGHVLHDLAKDPDERNNVADDPRYAPIVQELCVRLDRQ